MPHLLPRCRERPYGLPRRPLGRLSSLHGCLPPVPGALHPHPRMRGRLSHRPVGPARAVRATVQPPAPGRLRREPAVPRRGQSGTARLPEELSRRDTPHDNDHHHRAPGGAGEGLPAGHAAPVRVPGRRAVLRPMRRPVPGRLDRSQDLPARLPRRRLRALAGRVHVQRPRSICPLPQTLRRVRRLRGGARPGGRLRSHHDEHLGQHELDEHDVDLDEHHIHDSEVAFAVAPTSPAHAREAGRCWRRRAAAAARIRWHPPRGDRSATYGGVARCHAPAARDHELTRSHGRRGGLNLTSRGTAVT